MAKVVSWNPAQWKQNLQRRLDSCKRHRKPWEDQWITNANVVYNAVSKDNSQFNLSFDNVIEVESGEVDSSDTEVGTNYAARYLRFRHGQVSANPPSVIAMPTSSDHDDQQKADAADRIIHHGYEDKKVQEIFDEAVLKALVRGIGWIKLVWDHDSGDVFDYNEETRDINMHGDIRTYSPSTMDIYVDPVARNPKDIRFMFERHHVPYEDALFRFPEAEKILKGAVITSKESYNDNKFDGEDVVEIYEYWEAGRPVNGMAGRHAWCDREGNLLGKPSKSPHIHAKLPYYRIVDSEVEDEVYAKSLVEYVARQQDVLNRFDSASVDAMEFHGNIRILCAESTELSMDDVTNDNSTIIKYAGAIPPHPMTPPSLPPDMARLREQMRGDIQELMQINDAQLGNIKRETSGFAQQTSIESGNMANRRFFNQYTLAVEEFWKDYLGLVKRHWSKPRKILVLGKNKAFEAHYYSSADIQGGFDVVGKYGTSLPLDPNMRREQIMLLMEPLVQAGIPMQRILKMLKLDDLGALYDELQQGEDRQREIFDEMLAVHRKGAGDSYIPPEELENHEAYLVFCQKYRNSMEYKVLPEEFKPLIDQHIKERMEMAAQVAGTGAAAPASPEAPPADPAAALAQIMPPA